MVSPRTGGTLVKGKGVRSPWEIDQELVVRTFGRVIFGQLAAEPSRLHADGRVQVGIEIAWPPKDLRRNLILFGGSTWMVQCMIGQVAQQFAQGLGAVQSMTAEDLIDLAPIVSLVHRRPHPWPDIVTLHE